MTSSASSLRLLAALAATTPFAWAVPSARADDNEIPALNATDTGTHLAGKIVWADLFTSDAPAAAKFYERMFGWTAANYERKGWNYMIMSNHGHAVAGIVQRPGRKGPHAARWVEYVAVPDLATAVSTATAAGGRVVAPARAFPRRGVHAIIADGEGAWIGLLQSSSGDPADQASQPGDWTWYELFAQNPTAASAFYGRVFAYQVAPDARPDKSAHFIFSTGDYRRAGVAPMPPGSEIKADWLGFVHVADIDTAIAHVAGLGGEVISQGENGNPSRYAIIADPTGGTFGLIQFLDNAQANDSTVPTGTANPNHK